MVTGLAAAAAGMEAQQQLLNALSEDIANSSTTGYKSARVGFTDLLYQAPGRGGAAGTQVGAGSRAEIIGRNFEQGELEPTGRTLDVALVTPGFIEVRGAGGAVALTRAGSLEVNAEGVLETATGQALEPPIRVPAGTDPEDISIADDGTVSVAGRRLGQINLVEVANPSGLQDDGEGSLLPTAASGPVQAARGAKLQQGVLEASNVEMATVMTQMSEAQEGYALAGKAVTTQDEVLAVANGLIR
jgi:flagellar basal-body rod protein FlgG